MTQSSLCLTAFLALVVGAATVPAATISTGASFNGLAAGTLRVQGSPAAWQGSDGNDQEIFYSDGNVTTQLTDNDLDDRAPQQAGSIVAWQGWDGNDWEIFQFDGIVTTQLTDNDVDDIAAHFSGSLLRWQGWDGADWEIFQFDGIAVTQWTDNDVDDLVLFSAETLGGATIGENGNGGSFAPATPEPSAFVLLAAGLAGLVAWACRRRVR